MNRSEPAFDDIYREVILDHYRRPRNRGHLAGPSAQAEGLNPLCGDEVQIELAIDADRVIAVAFTGRGCSISQSSASMLTEAVSGRTLSESRELIRQFKALMSGTPTTDAAMGDVESLAGVAKLPVRVKCAALAWNVLQQALDSTPAGE